ncbi:hypothetical protein D9613_009655 [Agrocybe pediades]|uniref:MYND-type domain-containing protein n=1 Tax=Agrocybe pediades TaxID=84607 RepID=A0A8H4QWS9_9AGAR|nr:hypothetical protein D9613_009655 [Agrocybe pediades]
MHGVIRFLDTPDFPASAPDDYPKIIKSGIDEEGQHPDSPPVTGTSGIATLIHHLGRPQLFEPLFDFNKAEEFDLLVRTDDEFFDDVYVRRRGREVEIGFIDHEERWAQHGVRYRIEPEPEGSPYRYGKWTPLSTSDLGEPWGGSETWVRAQGAAIAKAIWWNHIFDMPRVDVSWSDMTDEEQKDVDEWLKEREEKMREKAEAGRKQWKELEKEHGANAFKVEEARVMKKYYEGRMACRADCGEQNPTLVCPECKMARYCSEKCMEDDRKYHEVYCGTEDPIPEEYTKTAEAQA